MKLARHDMILLAVAVVALIAAISLGTQIKKIHATDTQKIDGFKAGTAIFSLVAASSAIWFGWRWYKRNGGALKDAVKDRMPASLKGGNYPRY